MVSLDFPLTLKERQGRVRVPSWRKHPSLSSWTAANHGTPFELKDAHRTRLDPIKYSWWCCHFKKPPGSRKQVQLFQSVVALLENLPTRGTEISEAALIQSFLVLCFSSFWTMFESHDIVDRALNWVSPALSSRSVSANSNCGQICSSLLVCVLISAEWEQVVACSAYFIGLLRQK